MSFWILTTLLALLVAATLAVALLRPRRDAEPPAAYDLRVYRDQLREVDRDLARGVIAEADAERIRTEVSRRILAADAQLKREAESGGTSGIAGKVLAGVVAVALIGGSLWLYQGLGAPGYGDLGLKQRIAMTEEARANRPGQAKAEAEVPPRPSLEKPPEEYLELMARLRATVAERPDDVQGHILLAQNEARLGNFKAAYEAQATMIGLKGEEATATEYAELAEFMIIAAGGYVSPEAEAALQSSLQKSPDQPIARYYWGLMMDQLGRPDQAFRVWERLLRQSPPAAPWVPPIRERIMNVAARAGVDYTLPAPLTATAEGRGPTREDMEAAAEMTAEERNEMIRGMVSQLAERLATEGGPPEEWARLIGALGVLGETDQAAEIWADARETYAGNDAALAVIGEAAERAGLSK